MKQTTINKMMVGHALNAMRNVKFLTGCMCIDLDDFMEKLEQLNCVVQQLEHMEQNDELKNGSKE